MNYIYKDGLETTRLRTRFLTQNDIEPWVEFIEDKEATEFIYDFGLDTPEARSAHWINKQLGRYSGKKFGHQALINKHTGEFVGQCGLLSQEVNGKQETEVGYHILRKFWGQGYAPEAAKQFINYAFENKLTESVISIIDTANVKSQRVAEKNGLSRNERVEWNGMDVYIYRVHKEEWR